MALASVFELSPKDLTAQTHQPITARSSAPATMNFGGLLGMALLITCAILVINLTAKYPRWEMISASLVVGLTLVFSFVPYGARKTLLCIAATGWIIKPPEANQDFSLKVKQTKSLIEYTYIVGVVSSIMCGITILVHSRIDPDHTFDYLTYAIRPLIYAILLAELWLRPLKSRIEYLLQIDQAAN